MSRKELGPAAGRYEEEGAQSTENDDYKATAAAPMEGCQEQA